MSETVSPISRRRWANAAAVVTALATILLLVGLMIHYTRPPDLNARRAEERAKALAELNAANHEALENYGWVDQTKGVVRLPVTRAMEMVAREWSDPALGRKQLLQRLEKASAKPPPPVNPYE
ncbi:hypothetical protein NXS98_08765 [Fontisphaera persica]|uniref:hypothetical protein n=1 Tax=Fontisphaera persica TaxID=2974023 RepID=UPI0024BF9546|nr:hypothetical protein [Fontisphaera persica]WCJ57827.1 hypothetical protein NXS98_08765 [Fontisphaera persica]